MPWTLLVSLYLPAVQTLIPFSLFTSYCFFFPIASLYWTLFSCLYHPFHSVWCWLMCFSFLHPYHPSPFLSLCNLYIPSQYHKSVFNLWHWFFILPFSTSKPPLVFPTLRSLPHSLPVHRLVSSFLHLSFFLHKSWYCRCVPNVPQTLFSSIKLLSLSSPAAARITWAEQGLLNIEQHREGGTQEEKHGVRGTGRTGGKEKRKRKKERKQKDKGNGKNKMNWEKEEMGKETTTITLIYLWSPHNCHWQ